MTKQVTHSFQSVWEEMKAKAEKEYLKDSWDGSSDSSFIRGAAFAEKNCQHMPKVKKLLEAVKAILEITDRKHVAWDKAKEALKEFE